MREHGVLRRVLLVYAESARVSARRRRRSPPTLLRKAAQLFREFGEDYHEKKLEETYIFPCCSQTRRGRRDLSGHPGRSTPARP